MPRLFISFLFLIIFSLSVFAQEQTQERDTFVSRPAITFSPTSPAAKPNTELDGVRNALNSQVQPIQQVAAAFPQPKITQETPNSVKEPTEINEEKTEESSEHKESILDKPLAFGKKGEASPKKVSRPKLTGAITPIISVVGSLILVLTVFFVLMFLMKKVSPKGSRPLSKDVFEDLGRTFLSQKIQLHLLRLGNRLILVSMTADGVSPVTEITDPDEVVPLLGLCRQQDKNSSSEVFRRTLQEFSTDESEEDDGKPIAATIPKSALKPKTSKPALLDLYSDPDASLAEVLAAGLGRG